MPSLVDLYQKFKDSGFVVLALSVQEERGIVKEYAEKENLPFPVLLDTDGEVARSYGIRAHPAHFLIDGEGKMVGMALGARDWSTEGSRNAIRTLLEIE